MKSKVVKILVLLLVAVCILCGCRSTTIYQEGNFYYEEAEQNPIKLGVRSNTDTFDIDDVSLELYYGFYIADSDVRPIDRYHGVVDFFAMYLYEGSKFNFPDLSNVEGDDYLNIDDCIAIGAFTVEEALGEKYGYTYTGLFKTKLKYNHHEKLTIPRSVFSGQSDLFTIVIMAIYTDPDTGKYQVRRYNDISIMYKIINENTIWLSLVKSSPTASFYN